MSVRVHHVAPSMFLLLTFGAYASNLSGAIFTTTVDGSIVNENVHYDAKEDVYLDGGPGPNAPVSAAGLPAGDYYYQVTDPSGQDLLSSDHISCRKVRVNSAGVIDYVYPGTGYTRSRGSWVTAACQHGSGTDIDHADEGAVTVQLYPYDDTPNPGGVYKVWMTPTSSYTGNVNLVPTGGGSANVNGEAYTPGNYHGFVNSQSKTDNYKVRVNGKPFTPPVLTVSKFHDANMNGVQDGTEETITGWSVDLTDPTGTTNTLYTTAMALANVAGTYTFEEATPAGTAQTVAYADGVQQSLFPTADPVVAVSIANTSGETHTVVYGNVGLGDIDACKAFDRNGDGSWGADEPGIAGWRFSVSGMLVTGDAYGPVTFETGADGCGGVDDLYPGTYTVTELFPVSGGWVATGAESSYATINSSLDGSGSTVSAQSSTFTNIRYETADFGTKGYWHNQNGLAELTQADIDEVNVLEPYRTPSSYFSGGDEPFDGYYADGTEICNGLGGAADDVAPCGSFQAEVSQYLPDSNATGTHEEQLAQQLLAFIFNMQHRLDGEDAYLEMADGSLVSAGSLIDQAIDTWLYGTDAEIIAMQELLESFNSSDAVTYVPAGAGTITY